MNSIIGKAVPWVLAVGLVVGWVKSYGDARAAQALARQRLEQLQARDVREAELEAEREELRDSLQGIVSSLTIERDSLREVSERADRRSRVHLARLNELLADTGQAVTPELVTTIEETVASLEAETDACRAELANCDQLAEERRLQLFSTSESLVAKDSLLADYRLELERAIANQAKPAGLLRWGERALAVVGILKVAELVGDIVTNGGGG